MRFEKAATLSATVFAAVAALAASVQSYVAYTGRNDLLRVELIRQTSAHCSSALLLINTIRLDGPSVAGSTEQIIWQTDFLRSYSLLQATRSMIETTAIQLQVLQRGDASDLDKAAAITDAALAETSSAELVKLYKRSASEMLLPLQRICFKINNLATLP